MGGIGKGGFTLVEVLLAMSIFAAVVSTLFLSFNTIASSVGPIQEGITTHETATLALERLVTDVKATCITQPPAYAPPDGGEDGDRFRWVAGEDSLDGERFSRLRFASFEHLPLPLNGEERIGIIGYGVVLDKDGGLVLKRWDTALTQYAGEDEWIPEEAPVICDGIRAFELEFMDGEGEFHRDWDSDDSTFRYATPRALRIRLGVGEPPRYFSTTVFLAVARGAVP